MQRLLSAAVWDEAGVRDDLRGYVLEDFADPGAVLVVDDGHRRAPRRPARPGRRPGYRPSTPGRPGDQAWQKNICQARVMKPAAAAWAMAWSRTWCSA